MRFKTAHKGFTLLELVLCVALISLLMSWSVPAYQKLIAKNDIDTTQSTIVRLLYQAQTNARGSKYDSAWGIYFETGRATLFSGDTFATRTQSYDQTLALSENIAFAQPMEVTMQKMIGAPATSRSITFTSNANQESRTLTINEKGTITY